jgi:hypothetical protein
MYSPPLNFGSVYDNSYNNNSYSLYQPVSNFQNYGFQTVYLPNFNNILFYN